MQGRLSNMLNDKIQSFPFDSWKNEFEIASKNNFNILEWTIDSVNIFNNPVLKDEDHSQILELKKSFSMSIPSITCDFFMENPFFKMDNDKKINHQKLLLNFLSNCAKLKIGIIVIPLVDNGKIENKSQEITIINFFLNHLEFFKKNELQIIFESDFPPRKLKNFINQFPSKNFGINYDTGNSASLGYNFSEEFDAYFKNIKNIHIKDRLLNGTTVPLGQGNADLEGILIYLINHNYNGNLILQTARHKNNHLEVLCDYREYILNIINNYEKK